jgi:hypothetical protein
MEKIILMKNEKNKKENLSQIKMEKNARSTE